MSIAFRNEQRVVAECMKLYKEFPCLWDHRKVIYANKEARVHAYERMLDIYKQLFKEATINDVKRRIENMRASYRREHKRVLLAQKNGDVHVPQLWYYELMTFLNEVMDFQIPEIISSEDCPKTEATDPPIQKKRRSSPSSPHLEDSNDSIGRVSSVFLQPDQESQTAMNAERGTPTFTIKDLQMNSETESFGTTLGHQLKELDNMQKIFAEKLISDVIYNARLKRLTFKSYLML